jgi:hypothetical protein
MVTLCYTIHTAHCDCPLSCVDASSADARTRRDASASRSHAASPRRLLAESMSSPRHGPGCLESPTRHGPVLSRAPRSAERHTVRRGAQAARGLLGQGAPAAPTAHPRREHHASSNTIATHLTGTPSTGCRLKSPAPVVTFTNWAAATRPHPLALLKRRLVPKLRRRRRYGLLPRRARWSADHHQ